MPAFKNGLAKVGKVWHYKFKMRGVIYYESTRTENKTDAIAILAEKKREASQVGARTADSGITVRQAFLNWRRAYKGRGSAGSTKHLQAAEWASNALGDLMDSPCKKITEGKIDAWRQVFQAGKKPATVNAALRYLRLWLHFAVERKEIRFMPCRITMLKIPKTGRPVLAPTLTQAFLQSIDANTTSAAKRLAIRCILALGLRKSEVLSLSWEQFIEGADGWTCFPKGKGGKTRAIPVAPWLWELLAPIRKKAGLCFPSDAGLERVANWLDPNIRAASLAVMGEEIGPHRLRASFATQHSWAGTPIAEIQALLGHEKIETTMGYVEDSAAVRRAAQSKVARLAGFPESSAEMVQKENGKG